METAWGMSKNISNDCNARKEMGRKAQESQNRPQKSHNTTGLFGDTDQMSNLAAV